MSKSGKSAEMDVCADCGQPGKFILEAREVLFVANSFFFAFRPNMGVDQSRRLGLWSMRYHTS